MDGKVCGPPRTSRWEKRPRSSAWSGPGPHKHTHKKEWARDHEKALGKRVVVRVDHPAVQFRIVTQDAADSTASPELARLAILSLPVVIVSSSAFVAVLSFSSWSQAIRFFFSLLRARHAPARHPRMHACARAHIHTAGKVVRASTRSAAPFGVWAYPSGDFAPPPPLTSTPNSPDPHVWRLVRVLKEMGGRAPWAIDGFSGRDRTLMRSVLKAILGTGSLLGP